MSEPTSWTPSPLMPTGRAAGVAPDVAPVADGVAVGRTEDALGVGVAAVGRDGVAVADAATMRTALAQTERLGRLVTELLDLSKIDAGVLSLNRETLSVSSLVADVVAEAAVAAPSASFSIDVAGDLTVLADGERLHQVLVNLVDNAARHGGGETQNARMYIRVRQ